MANPGVKRSTTRGTAWLALLLSVSVLLVSGNAHASTYQELFWLEHSRLMLRGEIPPRPNQVSPQIAIEDPLFSISDFVVDSATSHIYFNGAPTLFRADLDGSNLTALDTGIPAREFSSPHFALHRGRRELFALNPSQGSIYRVNLDDIRPATTLTILPAIGAPKRDIAVDDINDKLYWVEGMDLHRAELDGSNSQFLFNLAEIPAIHVTDFEIDGVNGHIYWATDYEGLGGPIRRANLDGTGNQIIVDGYNTIGNIELDIPNQRLYFSDHTPSQGLYSPRIRAIDFDGQNFQTMVIGNLNARLVNFKLATSEVPEPATWGIVAIGALGVVAIRRWLFASSH